MKIRIITTMLLTSAVAAFAADAQEDMWGFEKGDNTLTISGNGASDKDFDGNNATLEFGLEHFFSDHVAGALRQGVTFIDVNDEDFWNGSTRIAGDVFLGQHNIKPFFGANIGYLYGDLVEDTFVAGPEIGVRALISESAFVNFLMEYQFLFEDADEAENTYDDGRFVYTLGIGVKL